MLKLIEPPAEQAQQPEPSNRLRRLRGRTTQAALARLIGVERTSVRRWESGREPIPYGAATQLADVFGVSLPFLLGAEGSELTPAVSWERKNELLADVVAALRKVIPEFGDLDHWKQACQGILEQMEQSIGDPSVIPDPGA